MITSYAVPIDDWGALDIPFVALKIVGQFQKDGFRVRCQIAKAKLEFLHVRDDLSCSRVSLQYTHMYRTTYPVVFVLLSELVALLGRHQPTTASECVKSASRAP